MKANIVLIGFSGVGKTSIAKKLAQLLNKKYYDTDEEIEVEAGMPVAKIFECHGEKYFREKEQLVVKRLGRNEDCVIATGGGVVLEKKNVDMLHENGVVICLLANPEVICKRIKEKNDRPLLQKGDLYLNITRLMKEREGLYKKADLTIDTSDLNEDQVIGRILTFINDNRLQNKSNNSNDNGIQ